MNCRHCGQGVEQTFVDLGASPPSNAYLTGDSLAAPETHYPLRVLVCTYCWLVQTQDFALAGELFNQDYAYFSSVSETWLAHAARYASMIIGRLGLDRDSRVIEIAANDGYLLKNFVAAGIPSLGIEPTASTASAAEALGIPILRSFFGADCAERIAAEFGKADLVIGNNVYAHVPDINDFTSGLKGVLKSGGTITLEFPHLMELMAKTQFDTIYHEHFSYLSLHTVKTMFERVGLRVWDVEQLPTHGGSLRIYGCHSDDPRTGAESVRRILDEELASGLCDASTYEKFQLMTDRVKDDFLDFLIKRKRQHLSVAGYGAAAKGNTLLNYAGVRPDLLPYVCDAAASKQGKFMPGSRIPILHPGVLRERKPACILIFPWNIAEEVIMQHRYARDWGARFVTMVPNLREL